MIIARLCGGLGNQLFIYAAARRLAIINNQPLKLDILSGYQKGSFGRKYLLDRFHIQAEIATPYESFMSGLGNYRRRTWRKLSKFQKFDNRYYVIEEYPSFDWRLLQFNCTYNIYLHGYWQSEMYFKDCADMIRRELEITAAIDPESIAIAEQIKRTNAVSIHVRSYSEVPSEHGVKRLEREYYIRAMKWIADDIENPHFFCFSDDAEWLKRNFSTLEFPMTLVTHNIPRGNEKAHEDLWLMSQCQHHIIANSTFSWWGAWFCDNPWKIVIAPRGEYNNHNFFPESWTRI